MHREIELLSIVVKEIRDDAKCVKAVDILQNGYNFIEKTVYDDKLAETIINLIKGAQE